MIISNTEKQILQKYYAGRIKSLSHILEKLIIQDNQEGINDTLKEIDEASFKISQIGSDWKFDCQGKLKKLEQEVENVYEK